MTRNIDVEALRGLRDRHGAAFPRGRVICREGDTTSEFYVVLQGAVEVWQRDRATGEKRVLFTIPTGGFFGEMSCFGGLPRSATCVAAEDSVLLFFNQETAIQLLGASPRFALGVIQTLCDRLRGANERIAALAASAVSGHGPSTLGPGQQTSAPGSSPAATPAEPAANGAVVAGATARRRA